MLHCNTENKVKRQRQTPVTDAYSGLCQTSMIEHFCKNDYWLKVIFVKRFTINA